MKIAVLSTDREDYLLQWWLPHHAEKFDFGVIVDYNYREEDGDQTYELYKQIVPNWRYYKVTRERVNTFTWDVILLSIEKKLREEYPESWIITLNPTEFVIGDLNYLNSFKTEKQILIPCHLMNDAVENEFNEPDPNKPLTEQRFHGVHYNSDFPDPNSGKTARLYNQIKPNNVALNARWMRSIHNFSLDYLSKSIYSVGRHFWNPSSYTQQLVICHYNLSPFTERFIERKLKIQDRLLESDRKVKRGLHHIIDRERIISTKQFYDKLTTDLSGHISQVRGNT